MSVCALCTASVVAKYTSNDSRCSNWLTSVCGTKYGSAVSLRSRATIFGVLVGCEAPISEFWPSARYFHNTRFLLVFTSFNLVQLLGQPWQKLMGSCGNSV